MKEAWATCFPWSNHSQQHHPLGLTSFTSCGERDFCCLSQWVYGDFSESLPITLFFQARSNIVIILINFTNCRCCVWLPQAQQSLSWGVQLHVLAKASTPMIINCLCSLMKVWGELEDPSLSSSCFHQLHEALPFIECGLGEGLKYLSQRTLEVVGSICGTRESPHP